ncbi:uncharacterized protein [Miscanthus floridulus]|uniref:uncharacterized protein n=1 Tax=Miscanthus floridulus TaxID=154761 RepID=UPI003457E528
MDSPFWGIVHGKASQALGQITRPVQFDTTKHFCIDYINFLVANFNTAYHTILGRPALAKFMAGILSLCANLDIAYAREKESFALVEATDISIHMQDCLATSQQIPPEDMEIPTMEAA